MEQISFSRKAPGRLIRAPQGFVAFVPDPLPPDLAASWELTTALSAADRALSELGGAARNIPNPHLLIRPFVSREAVLSSRIEGTQASLSDLFYFEAAATVAGGAGDVREVANYVTALEYGLGRLDTLPLSVRLIRELHGHLMKGVRGEQATPGELRRSQNWIGPPGKSLADATYVPPPPHEMTEALGALEKFLHGRATLPPLVRLALVHYQFEAIHPFLDGNGRVGRLLITLLLCHEGLLREPLLYLSAFFDANRDDYYRLLLAVSQKGAWSDWILFFLTGVETQAKDAVARIGVLLDLWRSYRHRFEAARSSALILRLIDRLFEQPVITIPGAAKLMRVTHRAASMSIEKLCHAKILTETTGKKRDRVFVARGILEAVDASMATPLCYTPSPTSGSITRKNAT
ncbi:MAG: Fic family protein [Deltaproteobacteria bacterium]|nr:Fic family protein [Deltaproteobacteria bacterium]